MSIVMVESPGTLNVLGLMLMQILDKAGNDPDKAQIVRSLRHSLLVKVSGMAVTVNFENGKVFIQNGIRKQCDSEISGDMQAILKVGVGGNPAIPFLKRKIRVKGNLLDLFKIMNLLRI